MAEFRLGRIKFIWKGDWVTGTQYIKDDVVRVNGKLYVCTISHIADANFNVDADNVPARWNLMADGQEWRGDWENNIEYYKGDLVKYGGNVYICMIGHVSAATDTEGLEADFPQIGEDSTQSKWDLFAESFDWKGNWVSNFRYKINDIIKYGGNIYLCNLGHTSAADDTLGREADEEKWDIYSEGFDWKTNWAPDTRYKINDVVRFGGTLYICNMGHTSAADFTIGLEADQAKWDYFNQGIEYLGLWDNQSVDYKVNDIVKNGTGLWRCIQKHTSDSGTTFEQDEASGYWEIFVEGLQFEDSWSSSTIYQPGDIVTYGGYAYVATTNHSNILPTDPTNGANNWDLFSTGFKLRNDYDHTVDYRVGDVVRVNGYTYVAVQDNPSLGLTVTNTNTSNERFTVADTTGIEVGMSVRFTGTVFGGVQTGVTYFVESVPSATEFTVSSEQDNVVFGLQTASGTMTATISAQPPNTDFWERLNYGFRWLGQWLDDVDYVIGDVVRYGSSSYLCVKTHHSQGDSDSSLSQGSINSRPDQDLNGTYWNLMAAGSEVDVMTTTGDLTYYSNSGPTRLPIGNEGQVLTVDSNGLPAWKYWGAIDQLYYVGLDGTDAPAPVHGITTDKPWRTVRYACEQIEKGPRNPEAAELLRRNRQFIQDETIGWIADQIATSTAPFTGGFTYDSDKCKRDVGLVLDALLWDFTHGGNVETRKAALSYINDASQVYTLGQEQETVAALQYAINDVLIPAVLTNTAPPSIYGSVPQYVDLALEAEALAIAEINDLKPIIFTAILSGDVADVPETVKPQRTILVKTGVFYEVLPMIVPTDTAIVGDELRSTNIRPAGSLIGSQDKTYTLDALTYLSTITDNIVTGNTGWTKKSTATQFTAGATGSSGSTTAVTSIVDNTVEMIDIVDNGYGSHFWNLTDPAGFPADTDNTRRLLLANKTFLQQEVTAWLADAGNGYSGLSYDVAKCERDVGYIIDALAYDVTYGGNLETQVVARSYYSFGAFVEPQAERAASVAVYGYLKTILPDVTTGVPISSFSGGTQDTSGPLPGTTTAATFLQTRLQEVIDAIDDINNVPSNLTPTISWASAALQASFNELIASKAEIQADALAFITSNFPTLVFDRDLCSRDIGYIVDALAYDVVFQSNFRSLSAARSYYRALTSTQVVLTQQKDAQLGMLNFIKYKAKYIAATGASAHAIALWTDIVDYINTGVRPPTTGSMTQNPDFDIQAGAYMIYANRDFLAEEAVAYIDDAYPAYASQYDHDACKRDVRAMAEAIWRDLVYRGSYNSVYAARYYFNALNGSLQEDMYYVRNGTGIRNQTVQGLTGTLGAPNAYGTRRPSAGAYVSLDPGWGPRDQRAWTTNKSCYVQNVTTFGTGCVGCKIDGALHDGGNDSIVSNDFTQVLSDGIGVWCTNLGRTELVSVFSYYGHIGYLAENGGKIRATNGNSSYGTYGCVSEGVDPTEIAITGVVNNRAGNAAAGLAVTNGDAVQTIEYVNAGSYYQTANYQFNGAGTAITAIGNETRDDGVFEVRLLDLNDSSGAFGGSDYVQVENVAQGGSSTSITISATDSAGSADYIGTKIFIQSGTAAGQYGVITSYNAGTKIAAVQKENGNPGWDHVVPGTAIVAPDPSSLYIIEPNITFSAPTNTLTSVTNANEFAQGAYHKTYSTHTGVAHTGIGGNGDATFNVSRDGIVFTVTIDNAGTGYRVGDIVTIPGSSVDGTSPVNDITVTVTRIADSQVGDIATIDYDGHGHGGTLVMVLNTASAEDVGYLNGSGTWQTTTLPTLADWGPVAAGDELGTVRFVVTSFASDAVAYSDDGGATWTATTMPQSGDYNRIVYGADKFVALNYGSNTPVISNNGITWANGSNPIGGDTTWSGLAYGLGKFVTVSFTNGLAAYSADGNTWVGSTPAVAASWRDVAFGNGRFVAVAQGGQTMISIDGINWVQGETLSLSGNPSITYGQGTFIIYADGGIAYYYSEFGLEWTAGAGITFIDGFKPVFANINNDGYFYMGGYGNTGYRKIKAGPRARGRAKVTDNKIIDIRLSEPGAGYTSAPTMTITDPNNVYEAPFEVRIGKGALAQPEFVNRGTLWQTATATITGDGYGDYFQAGSYIDVKNLPAVPNAGSNVEFSTLPGKFFKLVTVTQVLGEPGPYSARLQLSPALTISEAPPNGDPLEIRIRYSQCRLTGHDFLDIGTGNFTSTNYPGIPLQDPVPASETVESNGGRVFFTSTDQDGNFRVGDLFTVEQATGTATLNADAFNIAGLQELQLGSVELGTGGAAINEFSTDPFFTQDSDQVVPTQRAIKAYIASQIGSGSSTLNVNTLTAGSVFVADNYITTTTGLQIDVTTKLNFKAGIDGVPVAMNMFLHG